MAEVKALGLDRRVDRLGEQRPGEPAAAKGAASEGLDPDRDALGGRSLNLLHGDAHCVDLVLGGLAEDIREKIGLGGEVAVDGADGDPGAVGHGGDRRGDVAALGDQVAGGRRDGAAGLRPAGLGSLGAAIGHCEEVNHRSLLVSRRVDE